MESSEAGKEGKRKFASFGVRELILLVTIAAICFAWWIDRNRGSVKTYDVAGPLVVEYTVRSSPNTTTSRQIGHVLGIDYRGGNVIIYTMNGGQVLPSNSLIRFDWSAATAGELQVRD